MVFMVFLISTPLEGDRNMLRDEAPPMLRVFFPSILPPSTVAFLVKRFRLCFILLDLPAIDFSVTWL